jgi:hypothetical protein
MPTRIQAATMKQQISLFPLMESVTAGSMMTEDLRQWYITQCSASRDTPKVYAKQCEVMLERTIVGDVNYMTIDAMQAIK